MVSPARIELTASALGGRRSIQLSYEDTFNDGAFCRPELSRGQEKVLGQPPACLPRAIAFWSCYCIIKCANS